MAQNNGNCVSLEKGKWSDIKDKNFSLVVTSDRKKELLEKMGYYFDEDGFLRDNESKDKVKAEDGRKININRDKQFAFIEASHNFVRNIAGYSQLLTEKEKIQILPEKKK